MNDRMASIALLVIIASLVALLAGSTEDLGGVQMTFANRGINVKHPQVKTKDANRLVKHLESLTHVLLHPRQAQRKRQ